MDNFKTNAMRILDKARISYNAYTYDHSDGLIDGISVALKMGQSTSHVYKTLVTKAGSAEYFVFVIPVADELDLKAAARAVGKKSIQMIVVNDINKVTGYVRGGCSPIGMKKDYKTVLDSACTSLNTFIISGGKIGHQIEMSPKDLINLINCSTEFIIMQKNI
ncbi:Cys-tRNA(Pro) deacylase [Clostridium sp.]|uniref:Cys-tRNA(Pro) deacylase n=1 Tax=Clostridium sp. TaxID=1506 RepID=UPI001A441C91|nr:Cys-tRNA(Pro) deacylase [Clostridium sp.]MBK5239941.1 Cys-tRNA(Pro) deacylase [Clostridium sp.]